MRTEQEYNILKQRQRDIKVNLYLLNYQFQQVDEISGVCTSYPTFTNSSTSDIRRTCSLSIVVKNKSFDVASGNKIWLDKYVKVEVGIKNIRTQEYVYTNMGIYLVENPNHSYDATNNILSFSGIDLMAKLTGLRNGNTDGMDYIIPVNSNVRQSIIAVLLEGGFTNYVVDECTITVPEEIRISSNSTLYTILVQLRDLVPQYQMYFDVDGVFHYNLIPSGKNEPIMISDDLWKSSLISYSVNTNFDDVKNDIIIYGKTHDIEDFDASATLSGDTYSANIASITTLADGRMFGFNAISSVANPKLKLNGGTILPILTEDLIPAILPSEPNSYTVVVYVNDGTHLYYKYLGGVTATYEIMDDNPSSPFYVNGTVGKIRIVLSGGEYDVISSDFLAKQRAKWELYNRCKLQDSISIQCVPIYWLDVNWVIELTLPNKQGTEKKELYIIKDISTDSGIDGTQSINLMKYYPYYEEN